MRFPISPAFAGAGASGLLDVASRRPTASFALLGAAVALLVVYGGPALVGLVALAILVALILIHPIIGLGTILVISPIYLVLTPYVPKGIPVSFLLLALTFLGLAFRRVYEKRAIPFRWSFLDGLVAFLLLNGLVYLPLAPNLKVGIYGYHEIFRLFLLYVTTRLLLPGRAASRALLWAAGLTSFAVLIYGCIQPFWGYETVMVKYNIAESLNEYAGWNRGGISRAYSLAGSPITLGYMGMLGALTAIAVLSVPERNDAAARVALLMLAVSIGAAAFSYTRSSWLGTVAGAGTALFMVFRGRARLALLLVPLLAGFMAARFIPALAERIGSYALTIASSDPTENSFHYVALIEAARYFWANKLGVGLGTASFSGFTHGRGVEFWSENTFFMMGIQTGFQGLLALVVFLVTAGLAGHSLSRDPSAGRMERRLGAAVFMGMIAFATAGMSIPTLLDVAAFGPLWVAAALVVNAREARAARIAP